MTNSSFSRFSNNSGLLFLSQLSDSFLNFIQPNDFPEYLITDNDLRSWGGLINSIIHNKNKWIKYEQNLVICDLIVLIFAIFLVFGIVLYFCYQYCINRRDENNLNVKNVKNSKLVLAKFALFLLLWPVSVPVICSFFVNYRLNIGLLNFPHSMRMAVNDLDQHNENNVQNVKTMFINDYDIVLKTVMKDLSALPLSLVEQVKFASGATTLDHLSKLNETFSTISRRLSTTKQSLMNLNSDFAVLVENLTLINKQIRKCTTKNYGNASELKLCAKIKEFLSSFKNMDAGFFEIQILIDVLLGEISRLHLDDLKSEILTTLRQFDKLAIIFRDRLQNGSKTFEDEITSYDHDLQSLATKMASDIQSLRVNDLKAYVDVVDSIIQKYEIYRLIIIYAISTMMSITALNFILGFLCNICGSKASFQSRTRKRAANYFCCGISLCVACVIFLIFLTVVASIACANIRNIVCRGLMQHNEYPAFLNVVQRFARISGETFRIPLLNYVAKEEKIHSIINDCSLKGNFFEAFDYDRRFAASLKVPKSASSVFSNINNVDLKFDEFIPPKVEHILATIFYANLSLISNDSFSKLYQTIERLKFENTISALKAEIKNTSKGLYNHTEEYDQSDQLFRFFVENLERAQKNYKISTMNKKSLLIVHNLTLIDGQLKHILNEILANVSLAKNARKLLNNDLDNMINIIVKTNIFRLQNYFHIYNSHVLKELTTKVANCEPWMRNAKHVTVDFCEVVVQYSNWLWICVSISAICSMPTCILAAFLREASGRPSASNHYSKK